MKESKLRRKRCNKNIPENPLKSTIKLSMNLYVSILGDPSTRLPVALVTRDLETDIHFLITLKS